ncbi:MAG: sel1 repeat family protein [Candidatus Accumulibacter sp.]|jgi:TPR repeat protein|nr:sel1 repeat family protein [Accumulibacter sp.]
MFSTAKIQCPACGEFHCRQSRWHSSAEKHRNPGNRPYRCMDCSHRFMRPEGADFERWLLALLTVAAVSAVVAVGGWILMENAPTAPAGAPSARAADEAAVRRAAETGDAAAQFKLGDAMFQDPMRDARTSAQALRWMETAAANGNVDAMIYLGRLSRSGVGVLQNYARATSWIRRAALRGSSEGMVELARLYRDGIGVERDPVRAYAWFNRAAAARNLDAVRERETIATLLTSAEINKAQIISQRLDEDEAEFAREASRKDPPGEEAEPVKPAPGGRKRP